ncbi:hypothetical protein JTB14_029498 [Gonioctena quinquepunctata]|nr:hypothetical protein JTB14_029498 [Gonioctena quinquepunctata]
MVGNPTKLSYTPQINSGYPPNMSILQRIRNTLIYVFQKLSYHFYVFPKHNEILKTYFPIAPSVGDLYHNASLVLLNSHESFGQPVPHVPNMIQIGGFHVKATGTLSGPLKEFLDNSTEGVVYFSMGTNLPSENLPTWKRDVFLKVFGKLKQKVLWKWEDDLPGKPQNVKVEKWLPQQEILGNYSSFLIHD